MWTCNQAVAKPAYGLDKPGFFGIGFKFLAQLPDQVIDFRLRVMEFFTPDGSQQFFVSAHHGHVVVRPVALVHVSDKLVLLGPKVMDLLPMRAIDAKEPGLNPVILQVRDMRSAPGWPGAQRI